MAAGGADRLRVVLAKRGNGSLLRGWRRELDTDGSLDVGFQEFCEAALRLGVSVDAEALFGADSPDSLSLVGLAPAEGQLVERFRKWMTHTFGGPGEMFIAFEGPPEEGVDGKLPLEAFAEGCRTHGFQATAEELDQMFDLLDVDDVGWVALEDVMFLETDRKRREGAILKAKLKHRREHETLLREVYREDHGRAVPCKHRRAPRAWQAAAVERLPAVVQERRLHWRRRMQERVEEARAAFEKHIMEKHGNGVRAWRQGLDPKTRFSIGRAELGKYCRRVNLDVDVNCLWKALDQDADGVLRIEEVGTEHAAVLAQYQAWCLQHFGSCANSWEKLRLAAVPSGSWRSDKAMMYPTFLGALAAYSWPRAVGIFGSSPGGSSSSSSCNSSDSTGPMLCAALDLHGCGIVSLQDLEWLDRWTPPEYLAAEPDPGAWQELRAAMLRLCGGQPLRAWRTLLDTNDQNHASWPEFKSACRKVGFHGNIGGAWRFLDADTSGAISLQEYDSESAELLASFKEWIESNFGSVEFAFRTMDTDGSGSVCFSELKRACQRLGWHGSARQVFEFLDIDVSPGKRTLSYKELAFLDSWVPQVEQPPVDTSSSCAKMPPSVKSSARTVCSTTPRFAMPIKRTMQRSESCMEEAPLRRSMSASSGGGAPAFLPSLHKHPDAAAQMTPPHRSQSRTSRCSSEATFFLPFATVGARSVAVLAPPPA
mmetsp:Transcript_61491/g.159663  ORF Transcript_61491/g.159663 Transcript_61491/m.159663 type:complete len:710 (+) Transcript_61491:104-2233(+)